MELLPPVVTVGVCEFQHGFARCWRELESGKVVQVVSKRNGLHRAWLVPDLEPGYEAEPIGCNEVRQHMGQVFELVRLGTVFEVRDTQGSRSKVRGYLTWCPPEGIARLDRALRYARRTRTGRTQLKDIWPTELEARR